MWPYLSGHTLCGVMGDEHCAASHSVATSVCGVTWVHLQGGKGSTLVTCGIETDDPWSMGDDYKEWDCDNMVAWVRNLNEDIEEFEQYADEVQTLQLDGKNFAEMKEMHFWINRVDVEDENHAKVRAFSL